MKILHILHFGNKDKRNGVIEAVLSLACAQRGAGAEVLVASASRNASVDSAEYQFFGNKRDLQSLLDTFKPDIAHVHDMYWPQMPMVAYCLKHSDIPYLLTFHGGASKVANRQKWLKKKAARILLFNYVIRNARHVVYLTEGERRSSIARRTNPHSLILPNGIALPDEVSGHTPQPPYTIVFMSRMDYHGKSLDLLGQAIEQLQGELAGKARFRFYGYTYDDTYKLFDRFGDFAKYCGYVQDRAKEQALAGADIMILPSRSEGMPVSILEGLAHGLPCIVTPQTNMADEIQKSGCGWVCQLSAQSIADTIRQAVSDYDTNFKTLRNNARRAAQKYSWPNVAALSLDFYSQTLSHSQK